VGEEVVEELGYIARTKDFVDVGEFVGVFWRKIRGKNAPWHAFSSQELAGCAWCVVGGAARR